MPESSTILLVDDEESVRKVLTFPLERDGFTVIQAADGEEALQRFGEDSPDLVVLDIMLPKLDGLEVCKRLRATSSVPIIMLTARDDDMDVVAGLEAGADDYVVKPVQPRVLEARIRAVLRRSGAGPANAGPPPVERHGDLTIDRAALVVGKRGEPVGLAPTELRLLLELSATPGRVLSRQQLLALVWEHDYLGDSRLVDACVQRLRAKIEDDSAVPRYVQTVRGFGYRFGPL